MTYYTLIKRILMITSLLLLTSCNLVADGPPTVDLEILTTDLSIPQGSEGSVSINVSGTQAKVFSLYLRFDSPELYPNNTLLSLSEPHQLLDCEDYLHTLNCSYNGRTRSINIEQLEVKFIVPESHQVGTWDLKIDASVSTSSVTFLSEIASDTETIKLSITEAQ